MSMSTHIKGFRPADEAWKKMKAAWESCEAANVPVPREIEKFFGDEPPGNKPGIEVDLGKAVTPYREEGVDGFEVDINKLPKGITIVRFFNAY